jgi:hypothetical protein
MVEGGGAVENGCMPSVAGGPRPGDGGGGIGAMPGCCMPGGGIGMPCGDGGMPGGGPLISMPGGGPPISMPVVTGISMPEGGGPDMGGGPVISMPGGGPDMTWGGIPAMLCGGGGIGGPSNISCGCPCDIISGGGRLMFICGMPMPGGGPLMLGGGPWGGICMPGGGPPMSGGAML